MAFKIRDLKHGTSAVYSADTGPCRQLGLFCKGADVLIHEASLLFEPMSDSPATHSTVTDAAKIAARARVKKLYLVHFNSDPHPLESRITKEIMKHFNGEFCLGQEMMKLSLTAESRADLF